MNLCRNYCVPGTRLQAKENGDVQDKLRQNKDVQKKLS